MQYITPLMEDLNSLLFGGGGNSCGVGEGDYNTCYNGEGNAGCYAVGGGGHNCSALGAGNSISNNNCSPSGLG